MTGVPDDNAVPVDYAVPDALAVPDDYEVLCEIEERVLWLSTAIVHHANRVRPNPSGLKVGVTSRRAHRWSRS